MTAPQSNLPADFFKDYKPDALECILGKLADEPDGRARDIARKASTCKAFEVAAHLAVTAHRRECYEHNGMVFCGAAAAGGLVITGSDGADGDDDAHVLGRARASSPHLTMSIRRTDLATSTPAHAHARTRDG